MEPRTKIILATTLAALASGTILALSADEEEALAVEKAGVHEVGESKLVVAADGAKAYSVPVRVEDGGIEYVLTRDAPCVRRPRAAPVEACQRRGLDGGAYDFGTLNRFPASEAVGAGCQRVACSVVFGESAEDEEDAKVDTLRNTLERMVLP